MHTTITLNDGQLNYRLNADGSSVSVRASYVPSKWPQTVEEGYDAGKGIVARFTSSNLKDSMSVDIELSDLMIGLKRTLGTIGNDEFERQLRGIEISEILKPKKNAHRREYAQAVRATFEQNMLEFASCADEIGRSFRRLAAEVRDVSVNDQILEE